MKKYFKLVMCLALIPLHLLSAQENEGSQFLSLDRIHSGEFSQSYERTIQWIENGNAYVIIEKSEQNAEADKLVRYDSQTQEQSVFVSASNLVTDGGPLKIESFDF